MFGFLRNRNLTATSLRAISLTVKEILIDVRTILRRLNAMDAKQQKLSDTLDAIKKSVTDLINQHVTDAQAQIDAAVKAKEDEDDAAFDEATGKATDILNALQGKAAEVVANPPSSDPIINQIPPQSAVGFSTSGPQTTQIPDPSLQAPSSPESQASADAAAKLANPETDAGAVTGTAPIVATAQPAAPVAAPVVPAASVPQEAVDAAPDSPEKPQEVGTVAPPLDPNAGG